MNHPVNEPPAPEPTSQRVARLLAAMTLEEKIGQMVQADTHWKQDLPALVRAGRVGSLLSLHDPAQINAFQRLAVEESRLGIPLLIANDVIHGYRTIFPIPLALACTWDPARVEQVARIIAREAAANGTTWNFAPMVDICRDPRWGRVAEGAGEDAFLGAEMAAAWVRGFQSDGLPGGRGMAACAKHFAAYGGAEAGKDYNSVDMSERRLRGEYLPPYLGALRAGAATLMTAFNDLNGIPATANAFLLQTILREEWGFDGALISDYDAIGELILHGYSRDHREASLASALVGVDIDMMGDAYHFHLADLVRAGEVPAAVIDRAAGRVLALKERLGLFAAPYIDEGLAEEILFHPDHRALALQAAEEALVLLKNEGGLLPLDPAGKTIAMIGPLATERQSLLGSWFCAGRPAETPTILEALQAALPAGARLLHAAGCAVDGPDLDLDAALHAARAADFVILALGETDMMSGEAHSRAHIGLPGRQQELLEAVAGAGKPVAALVVAGRPLALPWMAANVPAILLTWQGGTAAGAAIANALLGRANPAGKLTISFPASVGQIPVYYAHKSTGRPAEIRGVTQFNREHKSVYLDETYLPLYPFGFGLSYTTYEYSDLRVETPELHTDGTLVVSVALRNTGARDGSEIVQCYVQDCFGSVTRPVKELKDFRKVALKAGEAQTVRFAIPAERLGLWDAQMHYRVEPGEFRIWVGPNSREGLEGEFRVVA